MKTKRNLWKLFLIVLVMVVFYVFIGWKVRVALHIETLHLPKGCKTVYHTKIWVSDVYWLHIKGEKVIKCDMGYEEAKAYIEAHNSKNALKYIRIEQYGGMSDIAIYDSQWDEKFWQQPDQDQYIKISYIRKL